MANRLDPVVQLFHHTKIGSGEVKNVFQEAREEVEVRVSSQYEKVKVIFAHGLNGRRFKF